MCKKHVLPVIGNCSDCPYDTLVCSNCVEKEDSKHYQHILEPYEFLLEKQNDKSYDVTMNSVTSQAENRDRKKKVYTAILQDKDKKVTEITRIFDQIHGKLRLAEVKAMKQLDITYEALKVRPNLARKFK